VPGVAIVEVPADLVDEIRGKPELGLGFDPLPGLHHGSVWALGYSDRQGIEYVDVNRERFGCLDVLYTWVWAGDQQWIYKNEPPHEVMSVDHSDSCLARPVGLSSNCRRTKRTSFRIRSSPRSDWTAEDPALRSSS
jgi:hypothetical protein